MAHALESRVDVVRVPRHCTDRVRLLRWCQIAHRIDCHCCALPEQEIDYKLEGQNADRFRTNFASTPWIKVPRVLWAYTAEQVPHRNKDPLYLCEQHCRQLRNGHFVTVHDIWIWSSSFFLASPGILRCMMPFETWCLPKIYNCTCLWHPKNENFVDDAAGADNGVRAWCEDQPHGRDRGHGHRPQAARAAHCRVLLAAAAHLRLLPCRCAGYCLDGVLCIFTWS